MLESKDMEYIKDYIAILQKEIDYYKEELSNERNKFMNCNSQLNYWVGEYEKQVEIAEDLERKLSKRNNKKKKENE